MIENIISEFTMESFNIVSNLEVDVDTDCAKITRDCKCGINSKDILENQTQYGYAQQPCNKNCHAFKGRPWRKNSGIFVTITVTFYNFMKSFVI